MSKINSKGYDVSYQFGLAPTEDDPTLFAGHFEEDYDRGALARVSDTAVKVALDGQVVGTLVRTDEDAVTANGDATPHYKGKLSIDGTHYFFHGFLNTTKKGLLMLNIKRAYLTVDSSMINVPEGF